MDGEKTIEALKSLEQGTADSMHQDMKNLSAYLSWFSPSYIRSPFKAKYLKPSNDLSKLVLAGSGGNVALCKRQEKEIVLQKTLKNIVICSLEVPSDTEYILIGDKSGKVHRLDGSSLESLESYPVCSSPIYKLVTFKLNEFILGSKSGDFITFSLLNNLNINKIHKFDSPVTALTCSNTHIAVGTLAGQVQLYSETFDLLTPFDLEVEIIGLSFINEHFAVAFGSEVRVLHCETGEELFQFATHAGTICCMEHVDDFLITGSADKTLKVWRTDKWANEVTLFGHSSAVFNVCVVEGIIHSLDTEGNIRISRLPNFPNSEKFLMQDPVLSLIFSKKLAGMLAFNQSGTILNLITNEIVYQALNSPVISLSFTKTDDILVVFQQKEQKSSNVIASLIELGTRSSSEVLLRTGSLPLSCTSTEAFKFLITGEVFRVTVWRVDDGMQEYIFCTHSSALTSTVCVGEDLYAADASGVTKKYSLERFEELGTYIESDEKPIKDLLISLDKGKMFVTTTEKTMRVWNLFKKMTVFETTFGEVAKKVEFQEDESHFFVGFRKSVQVWSCVSWTKCFVLNFSDRLVTFGLDHCNKKVVLVFEGFYQMIDNPFDAKIVSVYGAMNNTHKFFEHLTQIFKGYMPKFSPAMNKFIIEPFHLNILHVYSYFNMFGHIEEALKAGASFFPSRLGYDPIQISIEKHHSDSLRSLLSNLLPSLQVSPHLFFYLSNSLVNLNNLSPSSLSQLYHHSLVLNQDSTVPHFCNEKVKLPIIILSSDPTLAVHQVLPASQEEGRAIDFYQSYLHLNYMTGSSESVEFLKSLANCQQLEIFNTLFLKVFLDYKWKKMRWVHYFDCLLYILYLVCLIFGALSSRMDFLLYVSFGVNQVLLVYEFIQMLASTRMYFHSFVNYVDILRAVLFNVYCVAAYLNLYEHQQNLLFLVTLFMSILRAYGYFRIFKATRWLIYLVLELVNQLWAFFIVAVYLLVSLWVLDTTLEEAYSLSGFSNLKLEMILFFFILIINPLIIINLFINIVGNALEKIQNEKSVKDLQEVAEMVFEAETLMVWSRKSNFRSYLQFCITEQEHFVNVESITEKIAKAAGTVEEIEGLYLENTDAMAQLRKVLETSLEAVENRIKNMEEN